MSYRGVSTRTLMPLDPPYPRDSPPDTFPVWVVGGEIPFQSAYGLSYVDPGIDAVASDEHGHGAVQSFKEESDINNILRKYQYTGAVEWINRNQGTFEDLTGCTFTESMAIVVKAREMFEELPSTVRDRFANDPAQFFDFMHDPANEAEIRRLGLARGLVAPPVVPSIAPSEGVAAPGEGAPKSKP